LGVNPNCVAVGDFNGDGHSDLAITNAGGAPDYRGQVSILLGNGDGTFQPKVDYPVGSTASTVAIASSVVVGDFNGDGHSDLAVANNNSGGGTVSILLGNGDGTFRPRVDYATGGGCISVAVGDFDGDGRSDLAVALIQASEARRVLANTGRSSTPRRISADQAAYGGGP
jgi:hypothetical protein